ncbi:MAG TPA: hypothetical protein VG713_11480 [Pirellulales bacterium]|nr:hypothetical protein [Pirellulales bacterium]
MIAVAEFVNTIVAETQPYAGPERRCEPRYNVVMSAPAQPLDDSFHAVGEKFLAITRSLSNGGICFYYTKPIPQKYVAMQLANSSGEIITVVVEIRRCIARGTLFEIAGKFIERL